MVFSRSDRLKFMRFMDQAFDGDGLERFTAVSELPPITVNGNTMRGRLDDGREIMWTMPDNQWFITSTGSAS